MFCFCVYYQCLKTAIGRNFGYGEIDYVLLSVFKDLSHLRTAKQQCFAKGWMGV